MRKIEQNMRNIQIALNKYDETPRLYTFCLKAQIKFSHPLRKGVQKTLCFKAFNNACKKIWIRREKIALKENVAWLFNTISLKISASVCQFECAQLPKKKSICRCGGTKEEICTTSPSPMKPSLLKALRLWGKGTWNITQFFNSPRFLKSPLMEKSLITKSLLWHPMAAMHDIGLRESIWVKKSNTKPSIPWVVGLSGTTVPATFVEDAS